MNNDIKVSVLDNPRNGIKYRRKFFLGVLTKPFDIMNKIHNGSTKSIQEEVLSVGIFPTLLCWEEQDGTKKYGEVTTNSDKFSKNSNRKTL